MRRLLASLPAAYPVTVVYLIGIGLTIAVVADVLDLTLAVVLFTMFAGLSFLSAIHREMKVVHTLVNSQRDILLERIDALEQALHEAGGEDPDE